MSSNSRTYTVIVIPALSGAMLLASCGDANSPTYTLYRASPVSDERVHMATFDAKQSGNYNQENCFIARDLFLAQPGVTVRYWCEKGRYKE